MPAHDPMGSAIVKADMLGFPLARKEAPPLKPKSLCLLIKYQPDMQRTLIKMVNTTDPTLQQKPR